MPNTTPIVAGFHPDPSICRNGADYYLVASSFEYLPGLPVFHSRDLTRWHQVGNALTRPSQMAENMGFASSGNYAATIRYHNGRFWIIGTNVNEIPAGRGHFIINATDPAGPWSEPMYVAGAMGIDPDLAWDDEGTCFVTWCSLDPAEPGIRTVPVDLETGAMLSPSWQLWEGSGLAAPEGPHLYKVRDWWYLLLAEGGTERGHAVTIARSRDLKGTFEPAPTNPVLSHRSLNHPVQNTGHADFFELPDGTWGAVHLGVRPRGQSPGFHVNGRESFLVGIDWVDGWPVVDEERFHVSAEDHSFRDEFAGARLHHRWVGAGRYPSSFTRQRAQGGIVLVHDEGDAPSLLAVRVVDEYWTATATIDGPGVGAFVIRIDANHEYGLVYDGVRVEAYATVGQIRHSMGEAEIANETAAVMSISVRPAPILPHGVSLQPDLIELSVAVNDQRTTLAELDGRYLSTEVAGGFTGRVIGVVALTGDVHLHAFEYTSIPTRVDTPAPH